MEHDASKQKRDYLKPLYRNRYITRVEKLWLGVIEQAIFDAHLHATGGNYHSTVWVQDARRWFNTKDFEWVCEQLELEPDWVRRLVNKVEIVARKLRGKEYEQAAIATRDELQRTMNL